MWNSDQLLVFAKNNQTIKLIMIISVKQDNLTVAVELEEDGFTKFVTCEDLLLAAYELISRIFSEESLVKAYYATDPDTMSLREEV